MDPKSSEVKTLCCFSQHCNSFIINTYFQSFSFCFIFEVEFKNEAKREHITPIAIAIDGEVIWVKKQRIFGILISRNAIQVAWWSIYNKVPIIESLDENQMREIVVTCQPNSNTKLLD